MKKAAKHQGSVMVFVSVCAGFIHRIEAMPCAKAAFMLGAGREKAGDAIDLTIGLELLKTIGDEVNGKTTKMMMIMIDDDDEYD